MPKFELYETEIQIRISSKSIKSNIIEGFKRRKYKQEFIKFLVYVLSSCEEITGHLETLYHTVSLSNESQYNYFAKGYNHLGKKLNNFIKVA